jgi:hypothetical protein
MTRIFVKTQIRLQQLTAKREAGQGTLEYVGMLVVAAIVVVGVISVLKGADLDVKLGEAIKKVTDTFNG